jgi:hypothetical protein
MSAAENAKGRARANATIRLCAAREELWRAERGQAAAPGTPEEALESRRLGEATAELAARAEWLHWIERGTTIRPAADGEWGFPPESAQPAEPANERSTEPPAPGRPRGVAEALPETSRRRPTTVRLVHSL